MQTTLGVIPDALVDDVLNEGLLFLVLLTRGATKAMMLRLIMVVAMGYFSVFISCWGNVQRISGDGQTTGRRVQNGWRVQNCEKEDAETKG